jgi:hypothetical protein
MPNSILKMEKTRSSEIVDRNKNSFSNLGSKKKMLLKALAKNKQQNWLKKTLHSFKSLDVYGEKIEFTYKGQKSYSTFLGASFSVVLLVLVISFLFYELIILFTRAHTLTSIFKEIIDFETFGNFYPA